MSKFVGVLLLLVELLDGNISEHNVDDELFVELLVFDELSVEPMLNLAICQRRRWRCEETTVLDEFFFVELLLYELDEYFLSMSLVNNSLSMSLVSNFVELLLLEALLLRLVTVTPLMERGVKSETKR